MRTSSSFISGALAAVAVAGSAMANVVDPFTSALSLTTTSASAGTAQDVLTPYGGLWDTRNVSLNKASGSTTSSFVIGSGSASMAITPESTVVNSTQTVILYYTDSESEGYGYGVNFTSFTALTLNFASTFSAGILNISASVDGGTSLGSNVRAVTNGSSGTLTWTYAELGIGNMTAEERSEVTGLTIRIQRSGSNASGSVTISSLNAAGATANVPAPGAIALLGAAGLVGSRRRRG
jgi:hypothetical protein